MSNLQEFFTECHWDKLPVSWRESLRELDLPQLSQLLLTCQDPPHRYSWTPGYEAMLELLASYGCLPRLFPGMFICPKCTLSLSWPLWLQHLHCHCRDSHTLLED